MAEHIDPAEHPAEVLAQCLRACGEVVSDEQVSAWKAACDEPADDARIERWLREDMIESFREGIERDPRLIRGTGSSTP